MVVNSDIADNEEPDNDDLPSLSEIMGDSPQETLATSSDVRTACEVSDSSDSDIEEITRFESDFPIFRHDSDDENLELQTALQQDLQTVERKELGEDEIVGIIKAHAGTVVSGRARIMVISRLSVWRSAVSLWNSPIIQGRTGPLRCRFTCQDNLPEPSIDEGGPRREFFQLLSSSILKDSGVFSTDQDGKPTLRNNMKALSEGTYRIVGSMMATTVVQGGSMPRCLDSTCVSYVKHGTIAQSISCVEDISRPEREILEKILYSEDDNVSQYGESLECVDGVPLLPTMSVVERRKFVEMFCKNKLVVQRKPFIDQMMIGLNHYGFLDMLRSHGIVHILEYRKTAPLTAADVIKEFKVKYSYNHNKRVKEDIIMSYFQTFIMMLEERTLQDSMRNELTVDGKQQNPSDHTSMWDLINIATPEHVLSFATGAKNRPATGWPCRPSIHFDHESLSSYIKASTCSLPITIPVTETNQGIDSFMFVMASSLAHGATFSAR